MKFLGFFICIAASAADQPFALILKKRCLPCHNEELKNGGLSFADRESALRGGGRGPAIVPGRPDASLMIATLSHTGDLQMPPGPPLPAKEVRILKEWIKRGAKWSGGRIP
ncbi:MAG TPA: c-type cytochrome domain-containing protein [Bryobacteraceae bacterium]|nr:c-type cytochrome domain-containing protein [Bryobacteraceae bacterium]